MCRPPGDISRNPNVGLPFVKFDGKTYRVRANGHAETLPRQHAEGEGNLGRV